MYEATVSVEVVTGDSSHELVFVLELSFISPSIAEIPASLSGPGEPGCAPDFELSTVSIGNEDILHTFSPLLFRAIVGPEIAEELIEKASQQAIESGEF